MTDIESIAKLLRRAGGNATDFPVAKSEDIKIAEQELGFRLPSEYCQMTLRWGGIMVDGFEVCGLGPSQFTPGIQNGATVITQQVVDSFEEFPENHLVVFSEDGDAYWAIVCVESEDFGKVVLLDALAGFDVIESYDNFWEFLENEMILD